MQKILTAWAYMNYASEEQHDFTMLFSEEIENGWQIASLSSALDTYQGRRIVVITALLTK